MKIFIKEVNDKFEVVITYLENLALCFNQPFFMHAVNRTKMYMFVLQQFTCEYNL